LKCLSCQSEMVEKLEETWKGPIYYDVCDACGGMWFDMGEMDAMVIPVYQSVEAIAQLGRADSCSESLRKCPRCESQWLDKVTFLDCDQIPLDCCPKCHGFWLDGGELNGIRQELQKTWEQKRRDYDPAMSFIEAFLQSVFHL
jgi:rhomboid family protein